MVGIYEGDMMDDKVTCKNCHYKFIPRNLVRKMINWEWVTLYVCPVCGNDVIE
jgi:predicted RNA-binding Zn-ribbon protein involved in translation (DUF1610 family)